MTIRILKAEPFYPLGKPIQRPVESKKSEPDVQVRPGIWRKADGKLETRGYNPPAEPTKPAAAKYHCDTCRDRGEVLVQSHDICYRERMETCPDCDGEEPPAAALSDGWIEWSGGECPIPKARQGEYQIRFRNGIFGRSESMMARDWSWRDSSSDYSIVAYRLLPKGGQ